MKETITDINYLIKYLKLDKKNKKIILKNSLFPLSISKRIAKKIKKNDLSDPLFKQFVPTILELKKKKKFVSDPLLEKKFSKKNLIQKYSKRALLICSDFCPANCRFCFRKFFPKTNSNLDEEINEIEQNSSIEEIILSGGDPLFLDNKKLEKILLKLDKIPHLKKIRFHTRYLLSNPKRIDSKFIKILKQLKKQIIFVFHINLINEIDKEFEKASLKLLKVPCILLSQSVLLKDVNDNFESLSKLFKKLINLHIIPYYLHQLDKVEGSSHFETTKNKGKKLIKVLRENLSGYMIPKYVEEIPNYKNKNNII